MARLGAYKNGDWRAGEPSLWEENFEDGPIKQNPFDYTADVPLYNTNPTNVYGRIYDTPGNTPLNRARGPIRSFGGKYQ